MSKFKYGFRYCSVGGLEFESEYRNDVWYHVSGEQMLQMTASQLREIADVMDKAILENEDG